MKYEPKIIAYDSTSSMPIVPGQVRNIEIKDPNSSRDMTMYSIGYHFQGGDHLSPTNWIYNNAAHYIDDGGDGRIKVLTSQEIQEALGQVGMDVNDVLKLYLNLL